MFRKLMTQLLSGAQRPTRTVGDIRQLIDKRQLDEAEAAVADLHPDTPQKELIGPCLLAEIAFHRHADDQALALYKQVLAQSASFPDAHYGLSLIHHANGQWASAIQHAVFARNARPDEARFAAQLGLCHLAMDNHAQAEEPLVLATRLRADDKYSWNNLGIVQLAKGALNEALICFNKALEIDPGFQRAQDNLRELMTNLKPADAADAEPIPPKMLPSYVAEFEARDAEPTPTWDENWRRITADFKTKDREQALSAAESLALEHPADGDLCHRVVQLYQQAGELDGALSHALAFHTRNPDNLHGMLALGVAWMLLERHKEAVTLFRRALDGGLQKGVLYRHLGHCLTKRERHAEALQVYQDYARLYPSHIATANLSYAASLACEYELALDCFNELIATGDMQRHQLSVVYASTLMYCGRLDEAFDIIRPLLARSPNAPGLRTVRSQIHLLRGEFGPGWDDYEFRNLNSSKHFRTLPFQEWKGEPLEGRSIVVLAEQGLGDQIMFAQCLTDLKALKPARVVVEVIDRVHKTLARSFPDLEVIASQQDKGMAWVQALGSFDYFVALASLPVMFRRDAESFPRTAYLVPDADRVQQWRQQLQAQGPGPYVGVSWRGGTEHTRRTVRTLALDDLTHLLKNVPVQWVALQYGPVGPEVQTLRSQGIPISYWPESISDLDEFSALIAALDLVVTVCNTTVHYAGALGQKTWVMAPKVPEWRYGLAFKQLPWYPQVDVLRQSAPGEWTGLLNQIRQRLVDNF